MFGATYILPFRPSRKIKICPAPFHKEIGAPHAVDFSMPEGTSVLAARAGVVIDCESHYGRNYTDKRFTGRCNFSEIRHEDGETSLYAHLKRRSLKVKKGDRVTAGQVIALSGQTGYATYPHLHFGVYDAKSVNVKICWARK